MNFKNVFQKGLPYFVPVIAFVIISFIYFSPVMDGKELPQMDNTHTQGMAKELIEYEKTNPDEVPLWTNSMFGGMPAYQIKSDASASVFSYVNRFIRFGLPYHTVAILFLYLLGFYILLLTLKVNKWLSFVGAIVFAFASYNLIIIIAGHITKAYAIAMMAPVVAGAILTYRKNYLGGGILFLLALGSEVAMNHVQITYYLAMMLGVFVIFELVQAIKEKELPHFAKSTVILVVAGLLAVAPNATNLLTTYEYGKESIRGESELTNTTKKASSGLDKDYALAWSYGKKETLNLMIPNAVGGESDYIGNNPEVLKDTPAEFRQQIAQQNQYWGEMPFTSGPVYIGAIICFLFILGLFYVQGPIKWWLLASTVLSFLLAWGKNFEWFTDLFFYYFPLYNKFRTVSMILVIANLAMPLLAIMTIDKILKNPEIVKNRFKEFLIAFGLTGGLAIVFYIIPGVLFDFFSGQEKDIIAKQLAAPEMKEHLEAFKALVAEWESVRISIFRADTLRTILFIVVSAGLLWFYSNKKIKKEYVIAALGLLFFFDMWPVAKRYLNNDDFREKTRTENSFVMTNADRFILKYKETDNNVDKNFRVLNVTKNPFTEVNTSFFHNSIGGYHGAKLRRYQDVIDSSLTESVIRIREFVSSQDSVKNLWDLMADEPVLNMLNTLYVIYDPNSQPIVNFNALGNGWFVDEYKLVDNANEELQAIQDFDPSKTAIIDKRFADKLKGFEPKQDSLVSLMKLAQYKPHHLTYQINAKKDELAVFAEIYYDKGWNAYLDGKKIDYFRANYLLRALTIPKGAHYLEFKFEPESYATGQTIAKASSVLIVLLVLAFIGKLVADERKRQKLLPQPEVVEKKEEKKQAVPKKRVKKQVKR